MIGAITAGLFDTAVAASTNSFESIQTVTVGSGGQSSISFTSIPSTYTHLQIRGLVRTNRATNPDGLFIKFNSDSGTNYAWHDLNGDGASATANAGSSDTAGQIQRFSGANQTASSFGVFITDILDYKSTNKYKTVKSLGGYDANGNGRIDLISSLWMNSASAITQIDISSTSSSTIQQYSSFALYGIKG